MEPRQLIGAALLIGRIIASVYLLRVIRIQNKLIQAPLVDENGAPAGNEVISFRRTLHNMTLAILAGQAIPIIIDIVNMLNGESPQWLGFLYAASNVFTATTAAILIWRLYELAANVKEITDLETAHVQRKHDKERSNVSTRNKTSR